MSIDEFLIIIFTFTITYLPLKQHTYFNGSLCTKKLKKKIKMKQKYYPTGKVR